MDPKVQFSTIENETWLEKEYDDLTQLGTNLFILSKDQLFLEKDHDTPMTSLKSLPSSIWVSSIKYYIGQINDQPLYAIEVGDRALEVLKANALNDSFSLVPLKIFLETQNESWSHLICRSKQLLHWQKTSIYCGSCGEKTKHSKTEIAKICQPCNRIIYPTTSPAVIVLIERGEQILLARSPHFRPGVYSNLAGFVDAGETAEQTIMREVQEEVGITVKNIRYVYSQSWPFENSFMLGFIAEYDFGEIEINPQELEDARWFSLDNLPLLPYKSSIARKLIDYYVSIKTNNR